MKPIEAAIRTLQVSNCLGRIVTCTRTWEEGGKRGKRARSDYALVATRRGDEEGP